MPRSKGSRMRWPIYSGHWRFMLFDVSKKVFALFLNGMHLFTFAIFQYCIYAMKYKHRYSYIALYCRKTHEKCIFIDIRNYVKYFWRFTNTIQKKFVIVCLLHECFLLSIVYNTMMTSEMCLRPLTLWTPLRRSCCGDVF